MSDAKTDLRQYLRTARAALLWKLDGLGEYDIRRPLTPTGTNLLGLVKHVAGCEIGYFGLVFGRPFPQQLPWLTENAEPNSDLWATAEEFRAEIVELYRRTWAHSDETIHRLPLDATGVVPHWPTERATITLHKALTHMIAETHRHAGYADILRELLDGSTGMREGASNLPAADQAWWAAYRRQLEQAAEEAARRH